MLKKTLYLHNNIYKYKSISVKFNIIVCVIDHRYIHMVVVVALHTNQGLTPTPRFTPNIFYFYMVYIPLLIIVLRC